MRQDTVTNTQERISNSKTLIPDFLTILVIKRSLEYTIVMRALTCFVHYVSVCFMFVAFFYVQKIQLEYDIGEEALILLMI